MKPNKLQVVYSPEVMSKKKKVTFSGVKTEKRARIVTGRLANLASAVWYGQYVNDEQVIVKII